MIPSTFNAADSGVQSATVDFGEHHSSIDRQSRIHDSRIDRQSAGPAGDRRADGHGQLFGNCDAQQCDAVPGEHPERGRGSDLGDLRWHHGQCRQHAGRRQQPGPGWWRAVQQWQRDRHAGRRHIRPDRRRQSASHRDHRPDAGSQYAKRHRVLGLDLGQFEFVFDFEQLYPQRGSYDFVRRPRAELHSWHYQSGWQRHPIQYGAGAIRNAWSECHHDRGYSALLHGHFDQWRGGLGHRAVRSARR